jgi:hypothetical protein
MANEHQAAGFGSKEVHGDMGPADDREGEVEDFIASLLPTASMIWRRSRKRHHDLASGGRGVVEPSFKGTSTTGPVQKHAVRTRRS